MLKSAKANLAGLFSTNDLEWNGNLDWQPIPVWTIPRVEDYVLASDKRCDHFDYIMLQYMNTTEFKAVWKKHKPLIRYLEENAGKKLPSLTEINVLYDTLFIEQLKGRRYVIN